MIEVKNVNKIYESGELKTHALKNVNVTLRNNEFVSILGQSGCGKTTLLNVLGGLDRYSDGDLVINGVSTKLYKDRDCDTYRNHKVGFIFQGYNLIPHQNILENVELALTLSGVSKSERKQRAKKVLEKVGLSDKLKSKPSQLSGGQMQRVAIARALVNDPEIILADEPTGALDSATSIQIMELLKEISSDKLIVMVTHNPELAEKYSTRIIKLLDGEIVSDTNPVVDVAEQTKIEKKIAVKKKNKKSNKKTKMSFLTALFLSLKNLLTKKTRTILVSVAGSIGIIGIALILAISNGFSSYMNKMQEDSLSSYPITIKSTNVDFTSLVSTLLESVSTSKTVKHEKDGIYQKDSVSEAIESVGKNLSVNDLKNFNEYLEKNYDEIKGCVSAINKYYTLGYNFFDSQTSSSIQPSNNSIMMMILYYAIYYIEDKTNLDVSPNESFSTFTLKTKDGVTPNYDFFDDYPELSFVEEEMQKNNSCELSLNQVTKIISSVLGISSSSTASIGLSSFSSSGIFTVMPNNLDLIKEQYTLLGENSRFAENSDEAMLILDENNELDEYILYALGIISDDQMKSILNNLVKGNKLLIKIDYDSVIGKEYKVLEKSDYFIRNSNNEIVDFRTYNENNQVLLYTTCLNNALENCQNKIKIVGIARLKDSNTSGLLSTGVVYTDAFTKKMVEHYNQSEAVQNSLLTSIDKETPSSIKIFINSFDAKEKVKNFIEKYNSSVDTKEQISYTDMVGVVMGTISTIINAITYVLIAFVSVSLFVSSIMIGIITYISVIERTKEIGVLRSVGASKRDVKMVFTSESAIIGFVSGTFGVLVALLLTLPINLIVKKLANINNVAVLSPIAMLALVAISVILTLVAGLIPSRLASKKDPVVALREN